MSFAVQTIDLSKSFGEMKAVDNLRLIVHEGEMMGLVGPDGVGKTTTLRMLCGILSPTQGRAVVFGHDIIKDASRMKKKIGYLSQRFSLYDDLSVDENLEFFAEINGVYDYRKRREELLAFTRLTPFRYRLVENLSGGMKQKLGLACTLIHTPKILFLDEPTTGVDPVSRRDVWTILQTLLNNGITILMTTPYLDEAERCSRVALMSKGRLIAIDTPVNLKRKMRGEVIEIVCDRIKEASSRLQHYPNVKEVQTFGDRLHVVVENASREIQPICALLSAERISISSWRVIKPTLENVFISLLTHHEVEV